MSEHVKDVSDQNFQAEVLSADLPVMVDMWAPWCGPCRMVTPTVEQLGEDNAGKMKAVKMNVDENPETAAAFGITSIPTILFFKGGSEVPHLRMVGVRPKATYQQAIDELTQT